LGGGKKDIAMLMLYSAMDSYLRDDGKLGFVITQTVFKTKGAGDGFRRFQLGDGRELRILKVNDLVELQPFEGASNRTSTVVLEKGKATEYPVSYVLWQKTKPGRITMDSTLYDVGERTTQIDLAAQPVDVSERTSPWITARPKTLFALSKVISESAYRARTGAYTGGLNGVYWLRILERRPDGLLVVENLHDVGEKKVKHIRTVIEPDLVYPLLRGRDITRWHAQPSAYILMVQDPQERTGYDESWLKVQHPLTYAYLKEFEDVLRTERQSQVVRDLMEKGAFYSMYAIAEYTFEPYKVVWGHAKDIIRVSVVVPYYDIYLGRKVVVTDQNAMFIPSRTEDDMHYVAALLNSSPSLVLVSSYRGISIVAHVIANIQIPLFDPQNSLHQSLSSLSQQAHQLTSQGETREDKLRQIETEIDRKAAVLWGLSEEELEEIKRSLAEIS